MKTKNIILIALFLVLNIVILKNNVRAVIYPFPTGLSNLIQQPNVKYTTKTDSPPIIPNKYNYTINQSNNKNAEWFVKGKDMGKLSDQTDAQLWVPTSEASEDGSTYIYYPDSGVYEGKPVDMRFEILKVSHWGTRLGTLDPTTAKKQKNAGILFSVGGSYNVSPDQGGYGVGTHVGYSPVDMKIAFFEAGTDTPVKISGAFSFSNLTNNRVLEVSDPVPDNLYLYKSNQILTDIYSYGGNSNNNVQLWKQPDINLANLGGNYQKGTFNANQLIAASYRFTNKSDVGIEQDGAESGVPYSGEFSIPFSSSYSGLTFTINNSSSFNLTISSDIGWITYSNLPIASVDPIGPAQAYGDIEDKNDLWITENGKFDDQTDNTLIYRGLVTIPANNGGALKKYELKNTIDKHLDLKSVKVMTINGDNVTDKVTITNDDNTIITKFKPDELKDQNFYQNNYKVIYTTEIKKDTDLSDVDIDDGKYVFPNKIETTGNINADDETYQSNVVNAYKIVPAKPTITKQIKNDTSSSKVFANSVAVYPGDSLTYKIKIAADSRVAMNDVKLKDVLPKEIKPTSASVQLVTDGKSSSLHPITDLSSLNTGIDIDSVLGTDTGPIKNNDQSYLEILVNGIIPEDILQDVKYSNLPLGFDNQATVTASSYGNNNGVGWISNKAHIDIRELKSSVIKAVKKVDDSDDKYASNLEVNVGDKLNYKIDVKAEEASKANLKNIKIEDDFENRLNKDLLLNNVTAHYYDDNDNEIKNEQEELKPDKDNVITLSHSIAPKGHISIIYNVTVADDAVAGKLTNIAYIKSDSYGPNNDDNKRDGWFSNNAVINITINGTINFQYIDLDTGKEIDDHGPVQVTGKVDHKVSEYTKDQLAPAYIDGYAIMKEQIDDQAVQKASKDDPVITAKPQTYTYYYEKAALSMEAPKNWNFGRYNTSKTEATYYLPARQDASGKAKPYTVDVHDAYGVKDWTLKVQQKHQFTGVNPTNKKATILSGAQLNFDHLNAQKTSDDNQDTHPQDDQLDLLSGAQFKLPVGNETPTDLMSYHNAGTYVTEPDQNPAGTQYDNPGVKSFAYQFGDETNAGYSIGLHVPASTKREATDYTTTLTWSLSVAP